MAFEARRELQIQGAWLLRLQRSKVAVCNEAEMGTEPDRHRVQIKLVRSVVDTEDKVQASRRFYNGGVRELNTKVKQFPNTLFVRNLGFGERDFFEVTDVTAIAEPPRVQF